jgi:hypothetical protein
LCLAGYRFNNLVGKEKRQALQNTFNQGTPPRFSEGPGALLDTLDGKTGTVNTALSEPNVLWR